MYVCILIQVYEGRRPMLIHAMSVVYMYVNICCISRMRSKQKQAIPRVFTGIWLCNN